MEDAQVIKDPAPFVNLSYDPRELDCRLKEDGGSTLQIILKVSEVCNIACSYCYFFFGGDESYKNNPAYISKTTIDGLCRLLANATNDYRLKSVTLIIHGGEPLMLKRERMEYLFSEARRATNGTNLRITIQTNAMLVDDAWIDLLSKYEAYVGVSLDGPKTINDAQRIDKKGNGTYERTLRGIRKLHDAWSVGRIEKPGLLCVVDPAGPIDEIYKHFVHDLKFTNLDFLMPILDHDDMPKYKADALAQQMVKLLEIYASEKTEGVKIRFFDKAIKNLTLNPDYYASGSRLDAQRDIVFVVSSAGEIGPDDTLRINDSDFMSVGLNVSTSILSDIICNFKLNELIDESFRLPAACETCDFNRVCGGGELYNRYSATHNFENKSVHCNPLYSVYEKLCEILIHSGYDIDLLQSRLHAEPRKISL